MILGGDIKDGDTVHVGAGADGLIVGGAGLAVIQLRPEDAVLY